MKHLRKRALAFATALCLCFGLTGCGMSEMVADAVTALTSLTEQGAIDLVQGNLDSLYLAKFDPKYLESVDCTVEQCEQDYLAGIEMEAELFTYYFGIIDTSVGESYEDLDEGLKNKIVDLYKEIYKHTSFEITSAAGQDDGSYAVKMTIQPINIIELATEVYLSETYEPLNKFWAKYENADFETMTDADWNEYNNEYGRLVVQMVEEQLPNIGYCEEKTLTMQVEQDTDGLYMINSDDMGTFNEYVIYYP